MPLPANFWTADPAGWSKRIMKMTHVEIPNFNTDGTVDTDYHFFEFGFMSNMVSDYQVSGDSKYDTVIGNRTSPDMGYFFYYKGAERIKFLSEVSSKSSAMNRSPFRDEVVPPLYAVDSDYGGRLPADWTGSIYGGGASCTVTYKEGTNSIVPLKHWQPLTFVGTIAEVIGAMLMYIGVDPDTAIDKASFDTAYDDMILNRTDVRFKPYVWVRVTPGERVFDTIKRIIAHCSDFISINMSGKFSIISRQASKSTGVPVTHANVIGKTNISIPIDIITNYINAAHGLWSIFGYLGQHGYDPNFESVGSQVMLNEYKNEDSIKTFGEQSINVEDSDVLGKMDPVRFTKYPFYYYLEQERFIKTRVESNDAKRRTLIDVVQGISGLDYGVGFEVVNLDVDSNAVTGPSNRCIYKRVDFNSMTVKSTILREYKEDHIVDYAGVWDFVMRVDEPIGSVVEEGSNKFRVTLPYGTTPLAVWWYSLHAEIWTTSPQGEITKMTLIDNAVDQLPVKLTSGQTLSVLLVGPTGTGIHLSNNQDLHVWVQASNDSGGIIVSHPIETTDWRKMPVVSGSHP